MAKYLRDTEGDERRGIDPQTALAGRPPFQPAPQPMLKVWPMLLSSRTVSRMTKRLLSTSLELENNGNELDALLRFTCEL
jgi:hypothetical protein